MKRMLIVLCSLLLTTSLAYAQSTSEQEAPPPDWQPFEQALSDAEANGKNVLVDIYADYCGWCQKLQSEVYTQQKVRFYLDEHFELTRLDIEDTENTHQYQEYELTTSELAYGLGAMGTPTTVFLDPEGNYITRLPGFVDADNFLQVLHYIGTEAFHDQSYEEFVQRQK